MPITISDERTKEIIISFLEKSRYYYSVVETELRKHEYLRDSFEEKELFEVVKDLKPELTERLFELI